MRMVPDPGTIAAGRITFDGEDVMAMEESRLRDFRAHSVGMVSQNPFGSLNPVRRVGAQVAETLRLNRGQGRAEAKREAIALLDRVGIDDPERRARSYPHELSGGMCQRVMIALATASHPRLLLADEPTTALDVTTQAQILSLLAEMRREQGMTMLLVSHDFGVIAEVCDRVAVMYGGYVVETGPIDAIYHDPQHPYTKALLESIPELDAHGNTVRRNPLSGYPPELTEEVSGCVFAPRCAFARPECGSVSMALEPIGSERASACPIRPLAGDPAGTDSRKGTESE
jgi:oligopeptide/dipeptide ABC transporter ATP-binding protein